MNTSARLRFVGLAVGVTCAVLLLGGCTASHSAPASAVADRVVAHVERTLGVTPGVDCGDGGVDLVDGAEIPCRITDPETDQTYDATVRIIAPQQGRFDIDLSVHERAS
ncbi:MAG: hypothetical protein J7484_04915 [Microbacterium sp.]|nr:hypothetical protein [Microbacterium sp.]